MARGFAESGVDFELPGDWQYMQTVLPHLGLDEAAGYVLRAPKLVREGLGLLEVIPEAAAFSIAWGNDFDSRSGLRLPVDRSVWRRAETLRQRYTCEALGVGRSEWTARRILVCALLVQARRLNEEWDIRSTEEQSA